MQARIAQLSKRLNKNYLLQFCIGLVYLVFGVLKFFPEASPAEALAIDTIAELTFDTMPPVFSLFLLAVWETSIGFLLIGNWFIRFAIIIALLHMLLTFTPIFLFPHLTFSTAPVLPSLLGQYIAKNIIIIAALIRLYPSR